MDININVLLFVIAGLQKGLPNYTIGVTKSTFAYPDAITMITIEKDNVTNYIVFDSRFSNSQRKYIFKEFKCVEYKGNQPVVLFTSSDYTSSIYEPDFFDLLKKDLEKFLEALKRDIL